MSKTFLSDLGSYYITKRENFKNKIFSQQLSEYLAEE